ncbi:hypothetical protein OEA41_001634 [Lepraria neglecta]|uniref:Uncharacterized protein n=1 Tax=Lepraria neglecta TaxID=209136 RepID=A0AAE0DLJ5_9LECA|nr:hypothetical protein OEA41_001634 [Lepraria neglecta]
MSTSASGQGSAGGSEDKPKGLAKFMRRASLVLKRDKSKRQSISNTPGLAPVKDANTPSASSSTPAASAPVAAPAPAKANTTPTLSVPAQITQVIKDNKPAPPPFKPRSAMTAKENSAMQEQKARVMFAKYGLTLEPGEWTVPYADGAPRVEKKVRMRVHRTCHRCQTSFGAERICSNCQHTRCKKCPGNPRKTPKDKGKGKAVGGIAIDDGTKQSTDPLTMPHRATGKELARKSPTQRIITNIFRPKLNKYPEGYPGDSEQLYPLGRRELRPARTHVRWTCEKCDTMFKDHGKTCENCGHEKCDDCPRKPPKKSEEAA